jgi:carboxypeptidase Taq
MSAYRELERRFARIARLQEASGLLHWDMSTMMPPGGAAARGEQLAAIEETAHEALADPRLADLLDRAESESLEEWQRANLGEMRRMHAHAASVPNALAGELARAAVQCETVWRRARPAANFAMLKPSLTRLLGLVREAAHARGAALGLDPYDALLDQYDPGRRAADIERLFADLEQFLRAFLPRVLEQQARRGAALPLGGFFPADRQRALGERLMAALGFDFAHGRLDVSAHPFSSGSPDDVRITTRYDESDFASGLMGVLHETGHALYTRGLPAEWRGQPVGQDRGMTVHESQSLLIEMQVCRSLGFLRFAAPLIGDAFGGSGPAWSADNLYRRYTSVRMGFIRVDADEVTYPAHILLRYRIERQLIAGTLALDDLPVVWNQGMQDLLGLTPPDDRLGCLQDIHWPGGSFGYFPTYTLGAIAAAQLFAAAKAQDSRIAPGIESGQFGPLLEWLRANVHGVGCRMSTDELLRHATGKPLDVEAFKDHLTARYLT